METIAAFVFFGVALVSSLVAILVLNKRKRSVPPASTDRTEK